MVAPIETSTKVAIPNTQPAVAKTDSTQVAAKVQKPGVAVVKADSIKSAIVVSPVIAKVDSSNKQVVATVPAATAPTTTTVAQPVKVSAPVKALPEFFMPDSPRVTMTALGIGTGKITFPVSDSTNKVCYVGGIRLDSMSTKVELFQRAKDWITLNFQLENQVLHRDDLHNGVLIAKGFAGYTTKLNAKDFQHKLTWTMTITVKNGGYTYEMTDIYSSEYASGNNAYTQSWTTPIEDLILSDIAFKDNGDYKPLYKMHATSTDKSIKEVIESLKSAMKPFSVMNDMKFGG
ncbi:hypothetical protein D3C72_515400 [compost metagenome]